MALLTISSYSVDAAPAVPFPSVARVTERATV